MLNNLFKINKKQSKNKEKSHGRSMVEMLGVLAIIGVLSIGGIYGYTIAMRRYRANEILQIASKYAFMVYAEMDAKIRNDSENYYVKENFWRHQMDRYLGNKVVPFSNSGLGALPNGVNSMRLIHIRNTNNSGDIVAIEVDFNDSQLCHTAKMLNEIEDYTTPSERYCSIETRVIFNFYMN